MSRPVRHRPLSPAPAAMVVWLCSGCGLRTAVYEGVTPRDFRGTDKRSWTGTPEHALCGRCGVKP